MTVLAPPRRSVAPAFAGAVLFVLVAAGVGLCISHSWDRCAKSFDVITGGGDAVTTAIVRDIRLPRVAAGLLVGALLAVAGVLFRRSSETTLRSRT